MRPPRHAVARWAVRLGFLGLAAALALAGGWPAWAARLIPALSPLAALAGTIAAPARAGAWAFLSLAILVPAFFRRRWFCRWVCPAGTLFSLARRRPGRRLVSRRLGGFIFWFIVGGALIGLPAGLWSDPLAMTHRGWLFFRAAWPWAALVPALLLPLFLLLGFFQPMIWCTHFCPEGYLFDLAHKTRHAPRHDFSRERRELLAGVLVGLPTAYLAARGFARPAEIAPPILPPGALPARRFGSVCHRCYACVAACPTGVIRVAWPGGRPVGAWFQPELHPDRGACEEFCNACTQVCPTGAIRALTVEQKRDARIGTAVIRRDACLAWTDRQHCMVCDEYCPYGAIDTDFDPDGLPRPMVNEALCRGCGFCQYACPSVRDGKAITVRGRG